MNTVQSVVNEIMFIGIAKPEKFNVSVLYLGYVDELEVRVLTQEYCNEDLETRTYEQYQAAKVFHKTVFLGNPDALRNLKSVYEELSSLINSSTEAAA